jgi:transcriptional regulator with XRE-family HTH domain
MELRLKELLAKKGITMKEFSVTSGISQSNLSNYINGNISPTLDTLNKIADHLEVDLVELFKEKEEIELYARYNGEMYPINREDLLNIVLNKK